MKLKLNDVREQLQKTLGRPVASNIKMFKAPGGDGTVVHYISTCTYARGDAKSEGRVAYFDREGSLKWDWSAGSLRWDHPAR